MTCPRCARWIQLGLAILTSSFASAVNAATLDAYPDYLSGPEAPQTLRVSPDATIDSTTLSPFDNPEIPAARRIESLPQEEDISAEVAEHSAEFLEEHPLEAFPSPRIIPPGKELSDEEGSLFMEELADEALEALDVSVDELNRAAVAGENSEASSWLLSSQRGGVKGAQSSGIAAVKGETPPAAGQAGEPLPDGAIPRSITIPPAATETPVGVDQVFIAQITPDAALGAEASVVTPDIPVNGGPADVIEGGATRGANLFHSFQEFNINTGQRVYFANPVEIENILSRVTGGNLSTIDGLLGVDGAANLFLLNPNGVIFGPNARLDIRGSFTTSTAESVAFADGSEFAAVPQGNELLSVSVPLGVQFNDPPQGDIASTGELTTGQDLTLLGDQLYLEGRLIAAGDLTLQAQDTVTIRDTATEAFIARSGDTLTIQGNQGIDIWTLQHLEQTPFVSGGDLTLISDGVISGDAHFESGGNLQLLTLAGTPGNFVSFYDPLIFADGDVVFGDYTGVALKVEAAGSIQAGDIVITGPDTTFTPDGSGSDADLLASSRAAILRAGVDSGVAPNLPQTVGGTTFAAGAVAGRPPGSIVVSSINTSDNRGEGEGNSGDGGPIILAASGDIITTGSFEGPFFPEDPTLITLGSFSVSKSGDAGNGGAISISSGSGEITINEGLDSSSFSGGGDGGSGGRISISSTSGDITTNGSLDSNSIGAGLVGVGTVGNGGEISISSISGNITVNNELTSLMEVEFSNNGGNGGAISISSISGDKLIGI